ncbi:dethiobiotin synthase [Lysobacter pythonis]|uniref:ATP-dependent dethiobiotin synthetase BioD n=2 Tax=Solilutibacter pythonis TaxID=2483112 RepID=A0A3M2HV57_9GAMM|nr:dethiobiotin synthase [Lysobacter pythonis]
MILHDAYVTGTDTEIGKTFVTCALLRAARDAGHRVIGMKPVASGCIDTPAGWRSEDALAQLDADGVADAPYALRNPYALPLPVAPEIAARAAGVEIGLGEIAEAHRRLRAMPGVEGVLVEGVGGWLAPLSESLEQADVARALGLPVLMVVGLRLGCVHHARSTWRAILADGCEFAGWVANPVDPAMDAFQANLATLARVLGQAPLRVLARA